MSEVELGLGFDNVNLDMLLLCVKMKTVIFLDVRKDTQKFASFIEITRGASLQ